MNEIIITLIFAITLNIIGFVFFIVYSIHHKKYIEYQKKLSEFEENKQRIKKIINNDRKDFNHGA